MRHLLCVLVLLGADEERTICFRKHVVVHSDQCWDYCRAVLHAYILQLSYFQYLIVEEVRVHAQVGLGGHWHDDIRLLHHWHVRWLPQLLKLRLDLYLCIAVDDDRQLHSPRHFLLHV